MESAWTEVAATVANNWSSVTYGGGKFVAVANGGTNQVMYSTDGGLNWKNDNVTGVEDTNAWYSVTYGETSTATTNIPAGTGLFVAVASNGSHRVMYSTNGINWTVTSALQNLINGIQLPTVTASLYAVSQDGTNRVMYS